MRDGVRLPASCTNRESISLNSFQVLALEDIGCGLRLFTQIQNRVLRERYCQYLPCPPSSVPQIPWLLVLRPRLSSVPSRLRCGMSTQQQALGELWAARPVSPSAVHNHCCVGPFYYTGDSCFLLGGCPSMWLSLHGYTGCLPSRLLSEVTVVSSPQSEEGVLFLEACRKLCYAPLP